MAYYMYICSRYSAVLLYWGQFFPKSSQKTPHSLPTSLSYGVFFVDQHSDIYSALVTEVMDTISCYIGLRYNGTRLYMYL